MTLLLYLSPLGWDHINLTRAYLWRSSAPRSARKKFRPLRAIRSATSTFSVLWEDPIHGQAPLLGSPSMLGISRIPCTPAMRTSTARGQAVYPTSICASSAADAPMSATWGGRITQVGMRAR